MSLYVLCAIAPMIANVAGFPQGGNGASAVNNAAVAGSNNGAAALGQTVSSPANPSGLNMIGWQWGAAAVGTPWVFHCGRSEPNAGSWDKDAIKVCDDFSSSKWDTSPLANQCKWAPSTIGIVEFLPGDAKVRKCGVNKGDGKPGVARADLISPLARPNDDSAVATQQRKAACQELPNACGTNTQGMVGVFLPSGTKSSDALTDGKLSDSVWKNWPLAIQMGLWGANSNDHPQNTQ